MSENNDFLVFDWMVKDTHLEEKFNPKEQNLLKENLDANDDEFEYSDYIFQMHSVVNTCVFDKLRERREFAEEREKISSEILEFDTHVLKAVQCLKLISSAIYEFEIKFQEFRSQETISSLDEIAERIWITFRRWYTSFPPVTYRHYLRISLSKAIKIFKQNGEWHIIDFWLEKIRESIQRKANMIINCAFSIFHLDLWEAFDACEENGYNLECSTELKERISQLSNNSIDAMEKLRTLVDGYIKIKKKGCVAICFVDDEKKFYSLSGTIEYMGSCAKIKKNRQKFDSTIAKLSPSKDFIHADLTDKVKYYGHRFNIDHNNPYFSKPKTVCNADKDPDFESGDVSCCERKIMAAEPDAEKYEFYIRIDPCDFCRPALLPKDKDITFMTSEGDFKPLTKLKVVQKKDSGDLPWYVFDNA